MTPSPPLAHHDIAPTPPPTLAELVAKARHLKQPKTAQLEPHREELLRLRRAGDSVEVLAIALRGLGVDISPEALRLWLNRELGHTPVRRRKVRLRFDRHALDPSASIASHVARIAAAVPIAVVSAVAPHAERAPEPSGSVPVKPSSLILDGETPKQAMDRRLAAMKAARAEPGDTN